MKFFMPKEIWEGMHPINRELFAAAGRGVAMAATLPGPEWLVMDCGVLVKTGAFEVPGESPATTGGSPVLPTE